MDAQRLTGVVYVVYFILAFAGQGLKNLPLNLAGTAWYFVLAVFLFLLLRPADPLIAWALLPLAALGGVLQGIAMAQNIRDLQSVAYAVFGLFLVVLGYLVARSTILPTALGVYVAAAGVVWLAVLIPGLPTPLRAALVFFGGMSEVLLALWLLVG